MKINAAALALMASSAAAAPLVAVDKATSQVTTAAGTTAAPSKTDHPVIDPIETLRGEPCVMPWGCRDNSKDDDPALPPWGPIPRPPPVPVPVPKPAPQPHPGTLPPPRLTPTSPAPEVRTYSVPTETASVKGVSILPVAEPTGA